MHAQQKKISISVPRCLYRISPVEKASEGLCSVKTLLISLGLFPWKHLWTCEFCLPGDNQCIVYFKLSDIGFVFFFSSVLFIRVFLHCKACAIEIRPAPSCWTNQKRHFWSRKKGIVVNCNPNLHLNLEAWISLYFTCTDSHNTWKDLCFFMTNECWWFLCLAFLSRTPDCSRLL